MLLRLALLTLATVASVHNANVKKADDPSMTSLESLIQQQATVIQSLQTRLTALENLVQSQTAQIGSQAAEIAALKGVQATDIASLKTRLTAVSKAVGFTTYFSTDPVTVGAHALLRFDHVMTDLGAGYDAHTGIFTAPAPGLYLFSLNTMSTNDHSWHQLSIVREGSRQAWVHADGHGEMLDKGSVLVTMHLAGGEKVWVQHDAGQTVFRGGEWTVFSGILIQVD